MTKSPTWMEAPLRVSSTRMSLPRLGARIAPSSSSSATSRSRLGRQRPLPGVARLPLSQKIQITWGAACAGLLPRLTAHPAGPTSPTAVWSARRRTGQLTRASASQTSTSGLRMTPIFPRLGPAVSAGPRTPGSGAFAARRW